MFTRTGQWYALRVALITRLLFTLLLPHSASLFPLSTLTCRWEVKKKETKKKRNPFSNRFFISFGFLMFNFSLFYFSFFFIFFFSFSEILSLNYEDLVLIFFFDNGVGQLKEIRIVFTSRARRERKRERGVRKAGGRAQRVRRRASSSMKNRPNEFSSLSGNRFSSANNWRDC